MWTVSKSTVEAVFHTMPSGIRLMDAGACLVIAEVVLALRVTGGPVQIGTVVSIGADACGLVVLRAVHVGTVIECAVSPPNRSPPPLVEKMPVEARKGSVLRALVLKEQRALLCPELLPFPT